MANSISITRLLILLSIIIVVFGVAAGGYYYYSHTKNSSSPAAYSTENTPYSVLIKDNAYFAQADAAASAGNYVQAKQLYQEALTAAKDVFQKGQIEYKIAVLEDQYGDQIQAVDLYKQIVADPSLDQYKLVKAYSVMSMAELYYKKGDPQITNEIFKDAPYTSMFVKDNLALSYRHLEAYAASFYPLALPELRIAGWYAGSIDKTPADGTSTSTYPALIQNAISLANADVERIKTDPNASTLIPSILNRKASLYLTMYQHGLASAQDTEDACKAALTMFASIGTPQNDGFARYYYAVFLTTQGSSRAADLQNLLAPFYASDSYKNSSAVAFFASEKSNNLGQKARLVRIASEDPKFKSFLLSLGWNDADFKS